MNFENGSKIHFTPNSLKVLRDISDEICISHGFSVLPPYEKGGRSISTREYRAAEKGQSWKFRLMSDIQEGMKYSGNREQFTKEMAKRGYAYVSRCTYLVLIDNSRKLPRCAAVFDFFYFSVFVPV